MMTGKRLLMPCRDAGRIYAGNHRRQSGLADSDSQRGCVCSWENAAVDVCSWVQVIRGGNGPWTCCVFSSTSSNCLSTRYFWNLARLGPNPSQSLKPNLFDWFILCPLHDQSCVSANSTFDVWSFFRKHVFSKAGKRRAWGISASPWWPQPLKGPSLSWSPQKWSAPATQGRWFDLFVEVIVGVSACLNFLCQFFWSNFELKPQQNHYTMTFQI